MARFGWFTIANCLVLYINLPFLLCFTLYLRAIFLVQAPGGLYLEGGFNGGFFASPDWGLIFGGAYTWRGLFSEFYGILKKKVTFDHPPSKSWGICKEPSLNQFELSGALRLVKICEMMYTWTCALSSAILLLTILIARIESLRGPGRIICMGPYGPKTTKPDDKEFLLQSDRRERAAT